MNSTKAVMPTLQISFSASRHTECMQKYKCEVAFFTATLFLDPFLLQFRFILVNQNLGEFIVSCS